MSDLFANHQSKQAPILLVDASGSVVSTYYGTDLIFDKIKQVIDQLPEESFNVIFWNSNQDKQNKQFTSGIYKLPFLVKKSTIDQLFAVVKTYISNNCLTFPHLSFEAVPVNWISTTEPTKIYFITDGQMGYTHISYTEKNNLKNKLSDSIKKLFTTYGTIQLNIITVESEHRDFTTIEALNDAAGCDVYHVIMENKLTKYISKFISYTPNYLNGFVHINKNIPPPGHVPYADKYFSELRIHDFVKYLLGLVAEAKTDDELLTIVQNLSATVSVITKNKPKNVVRDIIQTFCDIFSQTTLDSLFVKFILTEAIEKENIGSANVFAAYRAQLKDLYKQANDLLNKNVKDAIGIKENFVTLPLDNKLVSGNFRLIDQNIDKSYPQSALMINHILMPVIPLDYAKNSSSMNNQCLRQWVRFLVSKLYNVNAIEDIVIYIVLGVVLRVVLSNVEPEIKNSYRRLGTIMLQKKRMNVDQTELEKLEAGELPMPSSGKIEGFYHFMNTMNGHLGTKLQPMTLWYAMCLALDNETLIKKQLIHCHEFIAKDFPSIDPSKLLSKIETVPIVHIHIPFENVLDYNCLITMEDTSGTGGYRFLPHQNMMNIVCCPVYVLSKEGYEQLLRDKPVCPICYTNLSEAHFTPVEKRPVSFLEQTIFSASTMNIFGGHRNEVHAKPLVSLNNKGTLVVLKGVVGSGKSTYSLKIKALVEKMGGHCIVEGTDKYCKIGMPIMDAINKVTEELQKVSTVDNALLVVVIDTCGEKDTAKNMNMFNVDFTGWDKANLWANLERSKLDEYLAWSLRNVLMRTRPTSDDNHWLNADDAGFQKCIDVHQSKSKALFGKKIPKLFQFPPTTKEEAITILNEKANAYAQFLETIKPIDTMVEQFVNDNVVR